MPAMSKFEVATCRSAPWKWFAGRVVLPWGLQGFAPRGEVLEIGAGSGAMAAAVLARYPGVTMTVTDVDDVMVNAAAKRLAGFGDRARVQVADANALPFPDESFDVALSWIMLHHTEDWEQALAELVRVLRPGGHIVGYDLLKSSHHSMDLDELREFVRTLSLTETTITPARGGLTVRFLLRK